MTRTAANGLELCCPAARALLLDCMRGTQARHYRLFARQPGQHQRVVGRRRITHGHAETMLSAPRPRRMRADVKFSPVEGWCHRMGSRHLRDSSTALHFLAWGHRTWDRLWGAIHLCQPYRARRGLGAQQAAEAAATSLQQPQRMPAQRLERP